MAQSKDAVEVLTRDHREVEALFGQYEAADDVETRTRLGHEIVHELAVHGEIEELRFYPRLREAVDDGDRLADTAIQEHVDIKQTLNAIDSTTAEDPDFDERMRTLIAEVRHHVEEEEGELFPRIRQALGDDELRELGDRLQRARSLVPTRPHPGAPTSPGAKAATGPALALVDRIRDVIRGAGD